MKRKITALVLALVFCLSLSVTAFAESVSDDGYTSGDNRLHVYAGLYVDENQCGAQTWASVSVGMTFTTSVVYEYQDASGDEQTLRDSGTTAAEVDVPDDGTGIKATSNHRARGSSNIGSWTTSLEIDLSDE